MSLDQEETEYLFSYGTLQAEALQLATFGRRVNGKPDTLAGYRLTTIEIPNHNFVALSGSKHHLNIQLTGNAADLVHGTVLELTERELEQADAYEDGADYKRVPVQLKSGTTAWVYLNVRT